MEILFELFTPDLVRSGVRLATPIILAAIGGALCNRAGVLNLALEGKMLLGAFLGLLAAFFLKSSTLGVLVAALAGGAMGAIFAFLYLRYKVYLVILPIAISLNISGSNRSSALFTDSNPSSTLSPASPKGGGGGPTVSWSSNPLIGRYAGGSPPADEGDEDLSIFLTRK